MGIMKYLLDTCALLWWWSEPASLSSNALNSIKNPKNEIFISAASAWEIATKHRIGKYPEGKGIIREWYDRIASDRIQEIAINSFHALKAGSIEADHRDPFDRMIASQSLSENIPVITPDPAFTALGAEQIW